MAPICAEWLKRGGKAATEGGLHITERKLLAPCRLRPFLDKYRRIARRCALIQVNPLSVAKKLFDQHNGGIGRLRNHRETEFAAHLQHRLVLAQDLSYELTDAPLSGDVDEAGHQQEADTAPLPVAADGDRIFGAQSVGIGKEVRDAERHAVQRGQQRQFPVIVELRQPRGNDVRKPLYWGEEPQPQILVAHMRGKVMQHWLVLRTHGPQLEHRPISQPLAGFELFRIWRDRQPRRTWALRWRDA